MDLSIIIVNWNSADFVKDCLTSIFATPPDLDFEVVVIDSGSFDECGAMIKRGFPHVTFIQSKENVGFSRANNLAFQQTRGKYLLFLNPDTEVLGSGVRILFEHARMLPRAGAVGCKLLNTDRSLQTSCVQSFPTIINQVLDSEFLRQVSPRAALWGMAPLYSSKDQPLEVEAIVGACIMMKREVFEHIGLFSTDYFMYAEDIDLCYKARQQGYVNYYVPNASIVHHGDGAVGRAKSNFAVVMAVESVWRFLRKYRGATYAFLFRQAMLLGALGRLFLLFSRKILLKLRGSQSESAPSWAKWKAIARWCIGLERWILNY